MRSFWLWFFSVIFTLLIAYYQRKTGPTYPVTVKTSINGSVIKNRLIRTYGGEGDAQIIINIPDKDTEGYMIWRRYNSYDDWQVQAMNRDHDRLTGVIPHQPPAGKVMYQIRLDTPERSFSLTEEPVVIRFKGDVPIWAMLPHIILIFLAMVLSTRTGLAALYKENNLLTLTKWTLGLLFTGGLIFGPIIQKYAFGDLWTGWPLGHDLTDNKTLIIFILWVIAYFQIRRREPKKYWVLIASVGLILIYIIPHSVLGSELDYTVQQ